MPMYEYKCLDCKKEFLLALTLKEHESGAATCPFCGAATCPSCGSKKLEQQITSFIAKTASKS
jgi:putative FmdB family regulatory protein